MGKKNRSGNREPRKPKQAKSPQGQAGSLTDLMKSRAAVPTGAK